jgi:hypothetical protein
MYSKSFSVILWVQAERIVNFLMTELHLDYRAALKTLFKSDMYKMLENQSTKLWQLSALLLFMLLKNEIRTGVFEIPEDVL